MTISWLPGGATVALLVTLSTAVSAQRPPSAGRPVVLTPRQRATLAALGWPPPPPVVRPRDDLVMRRDAAPVSGSLTALHAFATVATRHGIGRRPPAGRPRPRGPAEIPWGQALWRGVVRFEKTRNIAGDTETESGSYYVTWSEETVGSAPYVSMIQLHPLSLAYQYAWSYPKLGVCEAFRLSKSGSGFDGVYPDIPSGGNMYLTLLHGSAYNDRNAGAYLLNVFSPVKISAAEIPKTCSTGGAPYSTRPEGQPLPPFSFGRGLMSHNCTSPDTAFRAPPPFTTIAGEWTCQSPGTTEKLRWHFDRGIPPTDPTMSQDPCETPRGLLSLTQDQRGNALARLKQIRAEFTNARRDEARLRNTRNQLQGAFDLLIVASAGSDLGQKLLSLVTSDDMLEA